MTFLSTSSGALSETGAGLISGALLTTNTASGETLTGANVISKLQWHQYNKAVTLI